jgi:4-amino-4-deoxy-L-arabinose transferase-like glycosyltransferase
VTASGVAAAATSEPVHHDAPRPLWSLLPLVALGVLFAGLIGFVATRAGDFGRTYDEPLQDAYGESVMQWYRTGGADLSFQDYPAGWYMQEHGVWWEALIATFQHAFGSESHWYTRSVLGGVIMVFGVAAVAACGAEIAGRWGALAAAVGMALFPRYTGAGFTNSKDVPLLVLMAFAAWTVLFGMRRWNGRLGWRLFDWALVGVAVGLTTSLRIAGVIWFPILGAVWLGWWIRNGRAARADRTWVAALWRQAVAAFVVCAVAYVTMLATWPYLFLNPVHGLFDAYQVMSHYDWDNTILYMGQNLHAATELPWHYLPVWLVVGSPLPTIVLSGLGLGFIVADLLRRRLDARLLVVAALPAITVGLIVITRPTMLNGFRHTLYVAAFLVLLAAYAAVRTMRALHRHGRRAAFIAAAVVLVASQAEVVVSALRLHPYEYMYFSPVVGGYIGAHEDFETDYWLACESPALIWLIAHHNEYSDNPQPSVDAIQAAVWGLPKNNFTGSDTPDFTVKNWPNTPGPEYRVIHTEAIQGVTLCTVGVRNG